MLQNEKVAFIGPGVMAEAMIKGLLDKGLVRPEQVTAAGPRAQRGRELAGRYGIAVTADNAAAVQNATILILAVKPQVLTHVYHDLKGRVGSNALVLSIVAGARLADLERGLGHPSIVRSMP